MEFNITAFLLSGNLKMLTGENKVKIYEYLNNNYPRTCVFFARKCDFGSDTCKCDKKTMWRPRRVECRCSSWSVSQCCVDNDKAWQKTFDEYSNEIKKHFSNECTHRLMCFVVPDTFAFAQVHLYFERGNFLNRGKCTLVLDNLPLVEAHERPIESKAFKPRLMINTVVRNDSSFQQLVRLLLTHPEVDADVIDWLYDGVFMKNQNHDGFFDNFPRVLRELVLQYY